MTRGVALCCVELWIVVPCRGIYIHIYSCLVLCRVGLRCVVLC